MERRARPAAVPARSAKPVRTCIGCRKRAPASELIRFVAVERAPGHFRVLPDPARRMPGRGAHLHVEQACLALAQRRHAFGRALRVTGVVDTGELAAAVCTATPAPPAVGAVQAPPGQAR